MHPNMEQQDSVTLIMGLRKQKDVQLVWFMFLYSFPVFFLKDVTAYLAHFRIDSCLRCLGQVTPLSPKQLTAGETQQIKQHPWWEMDCRHFGSKPFIWPKTLTVHFHRCCSTYWVLPAGLQHGQCLGWLLNPICLIHQLRKSQPMPIHWPNEVLVVVIV